jgi:hypothetical protein
VATSPTPDTDRRSKGPSTAFISSVEARDARQDARTDTAWQAALAASEKAHERAAKTIKMLYMLLAAALLAVVVLTAMVLESELNVTSEGVTVGGGE